MLNLSHEIIRAIIAAISTSKVDRVSHHSVSTIQRTDCNGFSEDLVGVIKIAYNLVAVASDKA